MAGTSRGQERRPAYRWTATTEALGPLPGAVEAGAEAEEQGAILSMDVVAALHYAVRKRERERDRRRVEGGEHVCLLCDVPAVLSSTHVHGVVVEHRDRQRSSISVNPQCLHCLSLITNGLRPCSLALTRTVAGGMRDRWQGKAAVSVEGRRGLRKCSWSAPGWRATSMPQQTATAAMVTRMMRMTMTEIMRAVAARRERHHARSSSRKSEMSEEERRGRERGSGCG
eukprot:1969392-Rhodomonas_salina.1